MAVENKLGANLTKMSATPVQNVDAVLAGGKVRSFADTVEIAAADDDGSTFRIARVHSSWRIRSIRGYNDAITSGTAYEIGLYQTAENGGAVVDADAYASAVSMATASTAGVEYAFEARNIDKIQNRVWQDAGLTSDPNRYYDLVVTATTIGSAAGTLSFDIECVVE